MKSLYYFRHAESDFNKNYPHLVGGRSNHSPLTPEGRDQAKRLGTWIANSGLVPDVVYASPAVRTLQTARIALAEAGLLHEILVDDALQEMSQGVHEGAHRDEVYTDEVISQIAAGPMEFKHLNGESVNDVAGREHEFSERVRGVRSHETIFVFTHGYLMRCGMGARLGWSFDEIRANVIDNAAVVKHVFDESGDLLSWQYNIDTQTS